jgi:hypothetical protein
LFINVGHCPELPPPIEDLDEEVLLRKLETDPSQIKLPISVGNLENTVDKTGAKARKVDVIMSSIYYKKRVEKSEFYRQLIFMIVIPEVELKHGLVIDAKEHTILRKNKVWDQMQKQRIRKSPAECLIQEEKPSKPINFVSLFLQIIINHHYFAVFRKILSRRLRWIRRTSELELLPDACLRFHCSPRIRVVNRLKT